MELSLQIATLSDMGRVRSRNEDAVHARPDAGVVVVADGMGGHPSGDVASRLAADEAVTSLTTPPEATTAEGSPPALGDRMAKAVRSADERVRDAAREAPEREGMGTTLTAMVADPHTARFAVGHVGDSRAYRLRDRELEQITRDDSWVQSQVEAGRLDPEAARTHPWSSVLSQALGLESPAEPSVVEGDLHDGDLFLLCSDGLSGLLAHHQLESIVVAHRGDALDELAERLVAEANERGGTDNVTVALLRVTSSSDG